MSLQGDWTMTQAWSGQQPYSFPATFNPDGTISISGGFIGTWTVLGSTNQVSLAIANCGNPSSITSYVGNVLGHAMGGQATGFQSGGSATAGTWSAVQSAFANAPESELKAPGQ